MPRNRYAPVAGAGVKEFSNLVGSDAYASHSGVDLDMNRDGPATGFRGARERLHHLERADDRFAAERDESLGMFGQCGSEHDVRRIDTGIGERGCFADIGNCESIVAETEQMPRDG